MIDLLESESCLRYFRACIEAYGFIPQRGCDCGCWNNLQAANTRRHFELSCAQNAAWERTHGARGSVEFRFKAGHGSFRPYWMLLDVVAERSESPPAFVLVFHDEIIEVRGRNLTSLLREIVTESNTVTIAEHTPGEDGEPLPDAPLVESIQRYGQLPGGMTSQ